MQSSVTGALKALRDGTRFEALLANRSGEDRLWVWHADYAFKDHYEHVQSV